MEWFIKDILLFAEDGDTRHVRLEPGVNIITGDSQTGKSALISIIDYCLGSGSYRVPVGIIRQFTSWYGIRLQTLSEQMFIARKEPGNRMSTELMHFIIGREVDIPSVEELFGNSDRDSVVKELTKRLGMMDYLLSENEFDTYVTQAPTIRNVTAFMFQPQGLIANQNVLFYDTDPVANDRERDRLERILPYALGAVDTEYFAQRQRLEELKRKRRNLNFRINEQAQFGGNSNEAASLLFQQAESMALISSGAYEAEEDGDPSSIEALRAELMAIAEAAIASPTVMSRGNDGRLVELEQQARTSRERLMWLRREYSAVRELEFQTAGYRRAMNTELQRLRAVEFFNADEDASQACPLCNQELVSEITRVSSIRKLKADLESEISIVEVANPVPNGRSQQVASDIERERERLKRLEDLIYAEISIREQETVLLGDWANRQQLAGAINFYLGQINGIDGGKSDLNAQLSDVLEEIKDLEGRLDSAENRERLESALRVVSKHMGDIASHLPLEYPDLPLRIDPKRLTVVRDSLDGIPQRMNEIGSAENWLSLHLCALFALHEFFLRANRPVPSILVLDQPSQVYFPEEEVGSPEKADTIMNARQNDVAKVRQIYETIFDVVRRLDNRLQVILIDHAHLAGAEYQEAERVNWRDGRRFV